MELDDPDKENFKSKIELASDGPVINRLIAKILLAILIEIRDWRDVRKEKY